MCGRGNEPVLTELFFSLLRYTVTKHNSVLGGSAGTGDFLRPQGAIPQAFTPFGGYCLAPEVPQKGECRRGRRYFWPGRTRVGSGPATGPTLKTALRHIRALVGCIDKYQIYCYKRGGKNKALWPADSNTNICFLDQCGPSHSAYQTF